MSGGRRPDPVIEVDGLRRAHGRVEAVRDVSLTVHRGELFALLGTNGAGKTTTIEVLEGLQAALSAVTRSSEAAMLTSLPTVVLFLATPGALVPLGTLSEGIEAIARYSPMGSFTAVVRESWLGAVDLETLLALGALGVWVLLGWLLTRAVFRWEPRT